MTPPNRTTVPASHSKVALEEPEQELGYCDLSESFAAGFREEPEQDRDSQNARSPLSLARDAAVLLLVAIAAIFVQGYHFGVNDSAIYLPAVEQRLHPQLFPFGADMFLSHAHLSVFAPLVAASIRLLHVPLEWGVLAWHLFGVWLLLVAALAVARCCFVQPRAQWAAVLTLAAVLPVPVAGTALAIMDPYVTARTLSTPLVLLSVASLLAGRRMLSLSLLMFAALVHPLMAVVGMTFLAMLQWPPRLPQGRMRVALHGFALPFGRALDPYRETLLSRGFLYPAGWQWFEWIGVVAPLAILFALVRLPLRHARPAVQKLARAAAVSGVLATMVFLFLGLGFEQLYRLQPMRVFQLIYVLLFVLLGGLAGEYLPGPRPWRWLVLLLPVCAVFYAMDRSLYGASAHIDWPQAQQHNPWVLAFLWVRHSTPEDTVFALSPGYTQSSGEDDHGFRAIAQRSMLADAVKDSGAVSVFPQLAPQWEHDQQLEAGWDHFTAADFRRIGTRSPVTWLVVEPRQSTGLDCPYRNAAVAVCRLAPPPLTASRRH